MDAHHSSLLTNENYASLKMQRSLPTEFCAASFTGLHVASNGKVYGCQFSNDSIGNLTDTPSELFLNSKMAHYRESFALSALPPCSKTRDCLKCNTHYENSLSRLKDINNVSMQSFTELTVEDTVNLAQIKNWLSSHLPSLKVVTFNFEKTVNLDLVTFFEEKKIRIRADVESELITMNHLPENFWKKFESIKIKIRENLDNTFSIKTHNNLRYEIIYTQENHDFIHDLYLKLTETTKDVKINTLLFLDKNSESENIEFLKKNLNLSSRYNSFFYFLYDQLQSFFSNNQQKVEIVKLSKMYQMKWVEIKLSRQKICPLPFSQVAIYADGSYRPCCWIGDYDLRDSSTQNDITKIWNGEKVKNLRKEFITGNIKTCSSKIEELSCIPKDSWKYDQTSFTEIQTDPIFKFHWSFNGACNLECPMCSNWLQSVEFDKSEEYFEDLKKNVLPFIGEMELVGGEPFLQKRTFNLIEFMKIHNTLCVWNITSNGQFIFNEKIKSAITDLRIGLFSVSIDSLKNEIFSKIRLKGILDKTILFLDDLIEFNNQLSPGFKFNININFVIQKDNWREVEDLILFAKNKKIGLYISPVNDAPQFSIYSLPEEERNECLLFLEKIYFQYKHNNLLVLINSLKKLIRQN